MLEVQETLRNSDDNWTVRYLWKQYLSPLKQPRGKIKDKSRPFLRDHYHIPSEQHLKA